MYKLDKTYTKTQSFTEADMDNIFPKQVSLTERLNQGWYLSAMAYGINPYNPPKMEKQIVKIRKHKING